MTIEADPIYFMGRSAQETQRLIMQTSLYDGHTRHLLEQAGITSGMKVLDVGSGAGDVAFLAARLVGATGSIVGVDHDPSVLEVARARARPPRHGQRELCHR